MTALTSTTECTCTIDYKILGTIDYKILGEETHVCGDLASRTELVAAAERTAHLPLRVSAAYDRYYSTHDRYNSIRAASSSDSDSDSENNIDIDSGIRNIEKRV